MLVEVVVAVVVVVMSVRLWYTYTSGRCTCRTSMAGKTVIITGATAGIGMETARDLLSRGARVILACRNLEKGIRVASDLRNDDAGGAGEVVVRQLDTSDLASVRQFAKEVLSTEKAIHVLINNAGMVAGNKRIVTPDGLELTMATNHFGHFLLTNLLLGRLRESGGGRIINVSSLAHINVQKLDLNDLGISKPYKQFRAYAISKLCNILFTRELADRLTGTDVSANSLHPGVVRTDILNALDNWSIFVFVSRLLINICGKSSVLGAQTTIHLAVSEELKGVTGKYFADCKELPASEMGRNKDLASALWERSVQAVKLKPEEINC